MLWRFEACGGEAGELSSGAIQTAGAGGPAKSLANWGAKFGSGATQAIGFRDGKRNLIRKGVCMSLVGSYRLVSCLGFLALATTGSTAFAQAEGNAAPEAAAEAPATAAAPAAAPAAQPVEAPTPDKPEDKFAMGIYFNPVSILFGFYGLELDFSPMRLVSFNISGFYYSWELLGTKTSAYGGDVGAQFFLTGRKPMHGLYVYPRLAFAKAQASAGDIKAEATLFGIGATVGYQWNWEPFSLRLGGGVVDYFGGAEANNGAPSISLRGASPAIDLALGFVF